MRRRAASERDYRRGQSLQGRVENAHKEFAMPRGSPPRAASAASARTLGCSAEPRPSASLARRLSAVAPLTASSCDCRRATTASNAEAERAASSSSDR